MQMRKTCFAVTLVSLFLLASVAYADDFASTGTTSVGVTVGAEAAIRVDTATTNLTTTGTLFTDYTGTTNFTYKVRTTKVGGSGTITLQVTTDFSPSGGPSVASPPTGDDTLSYTCSVNGPGKGGTATACSGSQTASTSTATDVVNPFSANARSDKGGNTGSVAWTLTNDPAYQTGSYNATVTFTISAT